MSIFIGSVFNTLMVFLGTFIGMLFKKHLKSNVQDIVLKGLGFVTIYIAITSFSDTASGLNVLISMSVGAFIGELIDLEAYFNRFGDWLQKSLEKGILIFPMDLLKPVYCFVWVLWEY